jgi:hypothetical protein
MEEEVRLGTDGLPVAQVCVGDFVRSLQLKRGTVVALNHARQCDYGHYYA